MFARSQRRRKATETTAFCVEAMEQKTLLSGMSVADAKAAVKQAETELKDAQQDLKQTKQHVESDVATKAKSAQQETKEAKQADKKADKAEQKTQNQLDKAAQKRQDQKDARDSVKGPAIFSFSTGRGKKNSEKTTEQLKEERSQAERLKKLMEKNAGDDPTARQEQYMHGQQAKIHEINAELNRRKAKEAREDAKEEKKEAKEARKEKQAAEQNGARKIADAKAEVAAAKQELAEARKCLDDAEAAARAAEIAKKKSQITKLEGRVAQHEADIEKVRQEWQQTIDDIWRAIYFARELGLTDDSFDADDLEAWKQQMEELSNWVGVADDFDTLPPGLGDILEGGTAVLPLLINVGRDDRIRQMEWEMDGIDLGLARYWTDNKTAKDWMADDKHGENQITDCDQAKRVMRIIVDWSKTGSLDTAGLLGGFQDRIATLEGKRDQAQQNLNDARTCLGELEGNATSESPLPLDAVFITSGWPTA